MPTTLHMALTLLWYSPRLTVDREQRRIVTCESIGARERKRERETDGERERQRDNERDRKRERQRRRTKHESLTIDFRHLGNDAVQGFDGEQARRCVTIPRTHTETERDRERERERGEERKIRESYCRFQSSWE
jgi:hypothetical protein